ncbi:MAG: flagellar motor switch protein FliM [Microbacteriaceae bacterium]|jgi:flagellar motor switch protein FliM|nr:flagellar motor switch protein FliM [Microbacteriaceae bacterium]
MNDDDQQPRDSAARPYDFRRPTALARDHSRVLELAFETFARQWGTQLTAKVRLLSQVTCENLSMLTYDDYAAGLPSSTAMVLCAISDVEPKGVIQFPTHSALTWVNAMLGGTRGVGRTERPFTPIEHALVQRLMDDALEDLKYSLGPLLAHDIRVDAIQYNSQFAQAASTTELMVVAQFTIRVAENVARATLAIPARLLLANLGETNPTVVIDNAKQLLHAQLAHVPVDVAARLTTAFVRPAAVLRMQVGDILPIPHPRHRPLDVAVGGQTVATAAVGAAGSRLAIVITNPEETNS